MNEIEILEQLQQAVTAAVAASIEPDIKVVYVALIDSVPPEGRYIELINVQATGDGEYWGDEINHMGFLRLIMHFPTGLSGPYDAMETMRSICDYFYAGQRLQSLVISAKPTIRGPIANGADQLLTASVRYNAFQQ